ncbi:MAG: hypothetical protein K8U57_32065 [Planctomycetes bacterium]|nr:hypothetical protein [Planctomycetota bacterium]
MPRQYVCPHCEYEVRVERLRPDGSIICGFCTKAFNTRSVEKPRPVEKPQPVEEPLYVAEVVSVPGAVPESPLPVAEVIRSASADAAPLAVPVADWEDFSTPEPVPPKEAKPPEPSPVPLPPREAEPPRKAPEPSPVPIPAWDEMNERPKAKRSSAPRVNPWRSFGNGSRRVCIGIIVELVAITVLFMTQLIFGVITADSVINGTTGDTVTKQVRIFVSVVCVGVAVIGSALVAVGRTEQANIPEDRMGSMASATVALLGWVNVLTLLFGIGFLAFSPDSGFLKSTSSSESSAKIGGLAFIIALATRWYADSGAIINLGLVSGAMPSRSLRDRVGSVNLVCQVLGMCYLVLVVIAYSRSFDSPSPPTPSRNPVPRTNPGDSFLAGAAAILVFYVVTLVYLLLNLSLHVAAQHAASAWRPDRDE